MSTTKGGDMAENGRERDESAAVRRHTVAPGVTSYVSLRTLPNAVCMLHKEDEPADHGLRLYADPDGFVHMHVRPSNAHDGVGRLVLDAQAEDGGTAVHVLELRPGHAPTDEHPSPKPIGRRAYREGAYVRPALELDEALRITHEEAHERGYPLRPHADEAPHAFAGWLRAVSTPAIDVKPHVVERPELRHSSLVAEELVFGRAAVENAAESSSNWSGFELNAAAGTYDWVTGMWYVPSVTGESNRLTYSSLWIGLDGDGVTDLVQDGTEQENYKFDFWFFHISISVYYAWTEFLPQQPTEQQITNFPVHPGDEIFSQVWIGNAGSSPTLSGAFGVFFIQNLTTGEYTWVYTPVGSTVVTGSEAVWIMERPTVGGSLPDLANFHSATMFNAYARRAGAVRHGGYVAYQGANNNQITMFNGADTLSTVTPIDAYSMRFDWRAFH
jgi:Peptidase A4 family